MPVTSVWMLEKSNITVSGGGTLDGVTQGDGTHLPGRTITLDSPTWRETLINDNDLNFDDNDSSQTLSGAQTINGVTYANGTVVEAEYSLVLLNPATGQTWTVIGYNVNNSTPVFGTIEGLGFIGPPAGWPPVGVPLTVVSAREGPGGTGQPATAYGAYVSPPCFTPGTLIDTATGPQRVENLSPGDLLATRDAGYQPLLYVLRTELPATRLWREPWLCPVRIPAGALAPGVPARDLLVSPQHGILLTGAECQLLFAEPEVLAPAVTLPQARPLMPDACAEGTTYLHLVLHDHHILCAEGVLTESFRLGPAVFSGAPASVQADLRRLFPWVGHRWQRSARPTLRAWEVQLLAA